MYNKYDNNRIPTNNYLQFDIQNNKMRIHFTSLIDNIMFKKFWSTHT